MDVTDVAYVIVNDNAVIHERGLDGRNDADFGGDGAPG
jgi:hypothetical protein